MSSHTSLTRTTKPTNNKNFTLKTLTAEEAVYLRTSKLATRRTSRSNPPTQRRNLTTDKDNQLTLLIIAMCEIRRPVKLMKTSTTKRKLKTTTTSESWKGSWLWWSNCHTPKTRTRWLVSWWNACRLLKKQSERANRSLEVRDLIENRCLQN